MDLNQCWWCKIFYSNGHFCFRKGKSDDELTETFVEKLEMFEDKLEAAIRNQNHAIDNIGDSSPEIQGENIQLNSSTERSRNLSMRDLPLQTDHFSSCVNPMLTPCQTNSLRLSDSLDNTQNGNLQKSEESSGNSFSVPSPGELCQESDNKSNPSEDPDLCSKEDNLDSPMCQQRKDIAVSPKNMRDFISGSGSSAMVTPIDVSSVKENELSEEVVDPGSVADAGAVSVAGPSGLQAQPLRRSSEKRFECDVTTCGKTFRYRYSLKDHRRTHTGEKPFVCNICNRGFSHKSSLSNHQVTHTREKTFQCPICHKTFGRNDNLKAHLLTHSNEKPFDCSICSKGFTRHDTLKKHLQTHSDEKPFFCSICGREFTRNDSLKRHLRTHSDGKNL